ncbi:glia maturation factor gamma-like [Actinia tenebrosa]|uniref:Glia maturation factor gamma-like n=1 Tax=Actinia tenebrosa TaxID=6105 RepID=A0A6P8IEQ3_ACTTE|nr:glia maturation factor gamma-like [Actinia tenebrosa]
MSGSVSVCEIDPELKEKLRAFRFRKGNTSAAIIMKVQPENLLVILDEEHEDISVDNLREELPEHLPRYVAFSYVLNHDDGRVSYPLCFVFISPSGTKPELQMMYAGSKQEVVKELGFTKVFELRSVEEFTEEWLKTKLAFFR